MARAAIYETHQNQGVHMPQLKQPAVPNKLLRYLALRIREYGRRSTSEYMRQITRGHKRPPAALAIVLEDITGVSKESWLWSPQPEVNKELMANYPAAGRWVELLRDYQGVRV